MMKHFLLKFNHGVEIGANLAYLGHYRRTLDQKVLDIAQDEVEHMKILENILSSYGEKNSAIIDCLFSIVGYSIYWACQISPKFALNFVASSMEIFAIGNYGYLSIVYPDLSATFQEMAKKEFEHRKYFDDGYSDPRTIRLNVSGMLTSKIIEAASATAANKDPYGILQDPLDLKNVYPKWACPNCDDWFHMPYKYCKCGPPLDWSKVKEWKE